MKKLIATGILGLGIGGILFVWGYFNGYWRFSYPSSATYPVRGIDVSHHQKEIKWDEISRQGFLFVFIKATEGGDFKDPLFNENWRASTEAGLLRGAYHFFTFRNSGAEQAANFISVVPVESAALPPVVDFEFVGNSEIRPSKEQVLKELLDFLERVEKAYGKAPIIYATHESYDLYLKDAVSAYPLWIRDLFLKPTLPDGRTWIFWQFANNGRASGIKGRTDLNVFKGSAAEFEEAFGRGRANQSLQRTSPR